MPKKVRIAHFRAIDYQALDKELMDLKDAGRLSISQYISAKTMLSPHVPTMVKVYQRLPKSVTYFNVKGDVCLKMTNRAKVYSVVSSAESSVVSSVVDDGAEP